MATYALPKDVKAELDLLALEIWARDSGPIVIANPGVLWG